jgi:hypothetical protein
MVATITIISLLELRIMKLSQSRKSSVVEADKLIPKGDPRPHSFSIFCIKKGTFNFLNQNLTRKYNTIVRWNPFSLIEKGME